MKKIVSALVAFASILVCGCSDSDDIDVDVDISATSKELWLALDGTYEGSGYAKAESYPYYDYKWTHQITFEPYSTPQKLKNGNIAFGKVTQKEWNTFTEEWATQLRHEDEYDLQYPGIIIFINDLTPSGVSSTQWIFLVDQDSFIMYNYDADPSDPSNYVVYSRVE